MCGIAGQFGWRPSTAELRAAVAALAHRGPDGHGIYEHARGALIHTRLAIIDLSSAGAQPMTDPTTGVTIVLNGEIYNFGELRRELTERTFRGHSDTEAVLNLYLTRGVSAFARLRGMFAIAIWDPRDETLHLARDPFGIKPLLLHHDGGVLRFASEAKALFALGTPQRLNLPVVRAYLEEGRQNHGPATFFSDVVSLPPGHRLAWRKGAPEIVAYWTMQPRTQMSGSAAEIENAVWEGFLDSLEHHLIADVPVGVSLSSGLDSQLITRGLAELRRRGRSRGAVHTFTFGFDDADYDEISRVESADFGLPLVRHERRIVPEECLDGIRRAIRVFEMPLGGLGTLGSFFLMEQARAQGITVLLSGEGSDETFGGYRYYHYARLRELSDAGDRDALAHELDGWAAVSGEVLVPGTPGFSDKVFPIAKAMQAPDGTSLMEGAFLGARLQSVKPAPRYAAPSGFGPLRASMIEDLVADKLPKLLGFQDRASMAHGVETRVPFQIGRAHV